MLKVVLPLELACDVYPERDRVVAKLAGELDLEVADDVAAAIDGLIDAGIGHVVLDLRELSFLDSAGVHMLLSVRESAERRKRSLSLVRGPRLVHRVLELTATEPLFTFVSVATDPDGDVGTHAEWSERCRGPGNAGRSAACRRWSARRHPEGPA
jgi:anti-anti-sigma factor